MQTNKKYNIVAESLKSTVVAEYTPIERTEQAYQSEANLEKSFIEQLILQGYEYISVISEESLISNLRKLLEKLNNYTFSDTEWERFFKAEISNPNLTFRFSHQ